MSNFAVVQNGQVVQIVPLDVMFTVGTKTYSGSFLRSSTPAEKLQAGVWEIIHGARPDDKYYWVSGPTYRVNETNSTVEATYAGTAKLLDDHEESDQNGNPMFVQEYDPTANDGKGAMVNTTERLVTKGLKSTETAAVKSAAGSLLASTDWMIIRKVERNVDVPAAVATYRAAVIAEASRLETAIAGAANVDALAAIKTNWPKV
jgi:hypothetical protein